MVCTVEVLVVGHRELCVPSVYLQGSPTLGWRHHAALSAPRLGPGSAAEGIVTGVFGSLLLEPTPKPAPSITSPSSSSGSMLGPAATAAPSYRLASASTLPVGVRSQRRQLFRPLALPLRPY